MVETRGRGRTLEAAWKGHEARLKQKRISDDLIESTRAGFYLGAMVIFEAVVLTGQLDVSNEEKVKRMEVYRDELKAYLVETLHLNEGGRHV